MKSTLTAVLFLFLTIVTTSIQATPVGPMNYQGRLLDDNGVPVTGSYNFVIKIYDDESAGTIQYQETLNSVAVNDGVYSFRIGTAPVPDIGTWDIALWQTNLNDLFLEVVVNGETLSPRFELTSAPHAFTATFALSADALGNKTAAEFDNILEGVCVSGQGKWLDLLNTCLGTGAVVTGETLVTMMAVPDNNFQNLKLVSADLTGSQFDSVDFSGTLFEDTTLAADGLEDATLVGVTMDSVTFTGAVQSISDLDLTNATFKNMDMSLWNLTNATLTGFSAANLTGCPVLPGDWSCLAQDNPAAGRYVLLGPSVNLSASSAAKVDTFGANTLDVHRTIFDGLDLTGASFEGISFNKQTFTNTNLTSADLSYTNLQRILLDTTNLTNASFAHADIDWMLFDENSTINGTSFREVNIRIAGIQAAVTHADFSFSIIEEADFKAITDSDFSEMLAKDVQFDGDISGTTLFVNTLFFGSSTTEFRGNFSGDVQFTNVEMGDGLLFDNPLPATGVTFTGGNGKLFGDFGDTTFDGVTLRNQFQHTGPNSESGPTFHNIILDSINFIESDLAYATFTGTCSVTNQSLEYFNNRNFTGTDFGNCTFPMNTEWDNATCPDGVYMDGSTGFENCIDDDHMTPAPGP